MPYKLVNFQSTISLVFIKDKNFENVWKIKELQDDEKNLTSVLRILGKY